MKNYTIALFGEAEKGDLRKPYFCRSLPQLVDILGNAPDESSGLHYAVQALHYQHNIIFFRVKEEGFSPEDYLSGIHFLESEKLFPDLSAIGIPGVGDEQILEAVTPLCIAHKSIIILSESDLYDYLTTRN